MKHWVLGMAVLFSFNAVGQTEDLDANQKGFSHLTQSGKLFQVEIKPTDKHLHLFLTGVSAGALRFDETTVEASIGLGDAKRTFLAEKTKDPKTGQHYYKIRKHEKKPFQLKIQSGDQSEVLNFPPPN